MALKAYSSSQFSWIWTLCLQALERGHTLIKPVLSRFLLLPSPTRSDWHWSLNLCAPSSPARMTVCMAVPWEQLLGKQKSCWWPDPWARIVSWGRTFQDWKPHLTQLLPVLGQRDSPLPGDSKRFFQILFSQHQIPTLKVFIPSHTSPSLMQFIPPQRIRSMVHEASLLIRSLKRWKKPKPTQSIFPSVKLRFKLTVSVVWCKVHLHKGFISTGKGVAGN